MNTDPNLIEIFCANNKQKKYYPLGTNLLDIYNDIKPDLKYKVIVAKVNNVTKDLKFKLFKPKKIEFISADQPAGMRAYVRSLSFIFCNAVNKLYPNVKVRIEHPIAKGYYCKLLNNNQPIDQKMVDNIKKEMQRIVDADIQFNMANVATEEAIDIFTKQGSPETVTLLKSKGFLYTRIYELDGRYDWFLAPLAPSTGYITLFDLKIYHDGIYLQIPNRKNPTELETFIPQDKLFSTFSEHSEWNGIMGFSGNVGEMNNVVTNKEYASAMIKIAESLQAKKIVKIADEITNRGKIKMVLIAGPSSSGKTTFSKRLSVELAVNGYIPVALSMDDYFHPRTLTPRDENGDFDFESIYSVDLDFFNKDMNTLLEGGEIDLPHYNFEKGEREFLGKKLKLTDRSILIIEGIHALNPMLTSKVPEETIFRVYISALTTISFDNHNWIPTRDNRLLRRIIRDYNYRGYSAEETISRWDKVMEGEEKWIFPYQENADMVFNSALIFEICVLKKFAEPILSVVPESSPEYHEVHRLLNFLRYFSIVPEVEIPLNSLLREFLGGGTFKY
ncbi:MAG: nucleoside kinase [Paludibacteraceae bacterium]|nr:nucleoside kinase [Paludibacteraceae bacterium]MBR5971190.1 nucleoside kinase [Paludibacteraceae bacterium]